MRILLVEDDPVQSQALTWVLKQAGYCVDIAQDGRSAIDLGATEPYCAAILDTELPDISGLQVLSEWRQLGAVLPVLIVSNRTSWQDKVHGLKAGADDYISKPFHHEELLARLQVVTARTHQFLPGKTGLGDLELDEATISARRKAQPWKSLTYKEFAMLRLFMYRAGKVVSKQTLVDQLYDLDGSRDSNTLEVYISRLRHKLGADLIETRRGVGYQLRC